MFFYKSEKKHVFYVFLVFNVFVGYGKEVWGRKWGWGEWDWREMVCERETVWGGRLGWELG